jgi:hypothetical protein
MLPSPGAPPDASHEERRQMTDTSGPVTCEELAGRWLEAEDRATTEPGNADLAANAAALGEAYDDAIRSASLEELRIAWEAAQRTQAGEEIGGRSWADARRVSELLRTEYEAARSSRAQDPA